MAQWCVGVKGQLAGASSLLLLRGSKARTQVLGLGGKEPFPAGSSQWLTNGVMITQGQMGGYPDGTN